MMTTERITLPGAALVIMSFALLAGMIPARAELTSAWVEGLNSRARLVAGTVGNALLAGVEIRLTEGWKTYWRNPGTGGIRPEFDWGQSENVRNVQVHFPAPNRFTNAYGTSIGYKRSVVFPVSFEAIDPLERQLLRVSLDYAVCEALCIPAHASISLEVPGGVSLGPSPRLQRGMARIPVLPSDAGAKVLSVEQGNDPNLIFEVLHPGRPDRADAFAEGPEGWYLPAPVEVAREAAGNDTLIKYRLDLSGRSALDETENSALRFTITGEGQAVEQVWRIE